MPTRRITHLLDNNHHRRLSVSVNVVAITIPRSTRHRELQQTSPIASKLVFTEPTSRYKVTLCTMVATGASRIQPRLTQHKTLSWLPRWSKIFTGQMWQAALPLMGTMHFRPCSLRSENSKGRIYLICRISSTAMAITVLVSMVRRTICSYRTEQICGEPSETLEILAILPRLKSIISLPKRVLHQTAIKTGGMAEYNEIHDFTTSFGHDESRTSHVYIYRKLVSVLP